MTTFDWEGFKNETGAKQMELASVLGTAQSNVSRKLKSYRIDISEKAKLIEHYGEEVVLKYADVPDKPDIDKDFIIVPVINLDARGGFATNEELGMEYATDVMPFSKKIAREGDVVIPIYGDSMTPKFPSGCMVLIRKIEMWQEYIEYGATYVMELVDGRRIIKNVKKSASADNFLLESINPDYQPTDIPKKMIRFVFRVIMSIQRESL